MSQSLTFPELIALSSHDGPGGSECSESDIIKALMASRGLVAYAAAHLTSMRGIAISMSQLAARIDASPTLQLARAVAEEISCRDALKKSMALGLVRRTGTTAVDGDGIERKADAPPGAEFRPESEMVDGVDGAGGPTAGQGLDPAHVSASTVSTRARANMNSYPNDALCGARTRRGTACRRVVEPGARRCRLHGGSSTGPRTQAGRDRIAAAQRERWRRYREERGR